MKKIMRWKGEEGGLRETLFDTDELQSFEMIR